MPHENLHPRKLKSASDRQFGFVFSLIFAFLGLAPLLKHLPIKPLWLLMSALLFVLTIFRPQMLSPVNALWTKLGFLLQKVVSPFLMAFLFFFLFTPISLFLRLTGKDPLRRDFDAQANSYWIPKGVSSGDSMRNQF